MSHQGSTTIQYSCPALRRMVEAHITITRYNGSNNLEKIDCVAKDTCGIGPNGGPYDWNSCFLFQDMKTLRKR